MESFIVSLERRLVTRLSRAEADLLGLRDALARATAASTIAREARSRLCRLLEREWTSSAA
jgi:hypothetical protein